MQTTLLRQDILQMLQQQDRQEKAFRPGAAVNWLEKKDSLSRKARKYKDSSTAFTFIACFSLAVAGAVCLAGLLGWVLTPDLKTGASFAFLTLCNISSAFLHRIRLQKLQHQIALIDLLIALEEKGGASPA